MLVLFSGVVILTACLKCYTKLMTTQELPAFIPEVGPSLPERNPVNLNTESEPHKPHRFKKFLGAVGIASMGIIPGALIGGAVAQSTPAHLEIAGNQASLQLAYGQNYNETSLYLGSQGEKIATLARGIEKSDLNILGQPVGIKTSMSFNLSDFLDQGSLNISHVPATLKVLSDTKQIKHDAEWAMARHTAKGVGLGALIGLLTIETGVGLAKAYGKHLDKFSEEHNLNPAELRQNQRKLFSHSGRLLVAGLAIATLMPNSGVSHSEHLQVNADPAFVGTPLEGWQLTGGIVGELEPLIKTEVADYFKQNDEFYNELNQNLIDFVKNSGPILPKDGKSFIFVTDRHCNIGMDQIVETLMKRYDIRTVVSGGDDDLNGSFDFEAACTQFLSEHIKDAKGTLVIAPGNHDSESKTFKFEKSQGAKVLSNSIIESGGLYFIGSPDPRISSVGINIRIRGEAQQASQAEQMAATAKQGKKLGELACKQPAGKNFIAVVHGPNAGKTAIESGCGRILTALDGHTHRESGPNPVGIDLSKPNTEPTQTPIGEQFTGDSAGGAPAAGQRSSDPLDNITLGPLHYNAKIYIMTVDPKTEELKAISWFNFLPDKSIQAGQENLTPGQSGGTISAAGGN